MIKALDTVMTVLAWTSVLVGIIGIIMFAYASLTLLYGLPL